MMLSSRLAPEARDQPAASTTAAPHLPTARGDRALGAIDEMLDRMESVTRAGQRFLMGKIVAVLTAHPMASSGGPFIERWLADLRREIDKTSPDGGAFALRARALVSLMATARAAG
jgi:hypothetical protein